ncbi:RNA polymerase sigma factor [Actinocorallia libanotica]|uniref:RNA polymerase sigma factor n=1 Tax=Actinocorallia libanotica TaxID=46162 RepID=A0ABP4C148_9ACTN
MTAVEADPTEVDDGAVIRSSLDEPERFAALFDRYARQVHQYVSRRLGTQLADDIVGETFLIAFRRRETFDPARTLARPWLYGIATTLVARHRRNEERFLRALKRTGADPLPEPVAEAVARQVTAGAQERALAGALARLPRGDRDVLLLVAWADLSYEETAQTLDIPLGTVRSRLHRARRRLREALGGADPTQEDN